MAAKERKNHKKDSSEGQKYPTRKAGYFCVFCVFLRLFLLSLAAPQMPQSSMRQ